MILRVLRWLVFLPLQLLTMATFLLAELLHGIAGALRLSGSSALLTRECGVRNESCSIIVLNWNGRQLLEESLPALQSALQAEPGEHEVIVVDNGSTDDSVEWIRENHPWVRTLQLEENLGFGEGNNRGVAVASHPIAVLLNNDMIVEPGFLKPLLDAFEDPQLFAASSQVLMPPDRRREETGNTGAYWRRGYLHLEHRPIEPAHKKRKHLPILWAGGGSSAFDRERYLELGGFDSVFSPCYLEDTDLSYRAWRRGWKVVLAAESKVLHKHRSSTRRRFQEEQIHEMVEQRKLWYLWRNYPFRHLMVQFLGYPLEFGNSLSTRCYLKALRGLLPALKTRILEPFHRFSHQAVSNWIDHPLSYLNQEDLLHPSPARERMSGALPRLLVVSAYLPHLGKHGGAGRVFQLLTRAAREFDVTLVCFIETKEELEDLGQVTPYCSRVEVVPRRGFQPVSLYPYEPFEEFNCPSFREKLEAVALEEDHDLVHFEWTQMVLYGDLFPRTPKLVTEIEVNYAAQQSQVRLEKHPIRKLKRYYDTLQTMHREIQACRQVDKVICVTDVDRGFLEGYVAPDRLEVVNTGVETRYFQPDLQAEPDPDALVYVGAFRHSPNVDAMLYFCRDIWPSILAERPQTHLYIVGASPPASICRLGSRDNITVTGFVDDIRDYYQKAQVVIVPLRTGVGIRGKILEGWAAGKAMVATSLACLGIRAIHGENIIISDRAKDFADWTLALLRHPEHCRRLGEAGRKMALEDYDWDRLGTRMNAVYRSLLTGKDSGRQTVDTGVRDGTK